MKKPKRTEDQKRRELCILVLILFIAFFFVYLLFLMPVFGLLFGLFASLFLFFMALPRDRVPKDLERIRRDIDRRTYFQTGSSGRGIIPFENGGPTKPKRDNEDY
jgi:hypothetical protein